MRPHRLAAISNWMGASADRSGAPTTSPSAQRGAGATQHAQAHLSGRCSTSRCISCSDGTLIGCLAGVATGRIVAGAATGACTASCALASAAAVDTSACLACCVRGSDSPIEQQLPAVHAGSHRQADLTLFMFLPPCRRTALHGLIAVHAAGPEQVSEAGGRTVQHRRQFTPAPWVHCKKTVIPDGARQPPDPNLARMHGSGRSGSVWSMAAAEKEAPRETNSKLQPLHASRLCRASLQWGCLLGSGGMVSPGRSCPGSLLRPSFNRLLHSLPLSSPPQSDFVALVTPTVCHNAKSTTANTHLLLPVGCDRAVLRSASASCRSLRRAATPACPLPRWYPRTRRCC